MAFTVTMEEAAGNFAALVNRVIASQDESLVMVSGKPTARVTAEPEMPAALDAAQTLMGCSGDDTLWEEDIAYGRSLLLPPKSPWD